MSSSVEPPPLHSGEMSPTAAPPSATRPKAKGRATPLRDAKTTAQQRIVVCARLRPPFPHERSCSMIHADPVDNEISVQCGDHVKTFVFDHVFGPSSTQSDLFAVVARPFVDCLLRGVNACVIAYGQTGAGKTFTLSELTRDNEGVVPRTMNELFARIDAAAAQFDFEVHISYLQIYLETIQDLLNPSSKNHRLREKNGRIYVDGLTHHHVRSAAQVWSLLEVGNKAKIMAQTRMNRESSRSHTVFSVTLERRPKERSPSKLGAASAVDLLEDNKVLRSMFMCVDLAGSERASKTLLEGQQFEEAKSINLSLSSLGNVIAALAENASDPVRPLFVPWRDSKLTRMLQDVVGGNARTTLVVNVGPADENVQESVTSLLFGQRAAKVRVHPMVNVDVDYKALARQLQQRLDELASRPESGGVGALIRLEKVEKSLLDERQKTQQLQAMLMWEKTRADRFEAQMRLNIEVKGAVASPEVVKAERTAGKSPAPSLPSTVSPQRSDRTSSGSVARPAPKSFVLGDTMRNAVASFHGIEERLQELEKAGASRDEEEGTVETGATEEDAAASREDGITAGGGREGETGVLGAQRMDDSGTADLMEARMVELEETLRDSRENISRLEKQLSVQSDHSTALGQQLHLAEQNAGTLEENRALIQKDLDAKKEECKALGDTLRLRDRWIRSIHRTLLRLYKCAHDIMVSPLCPPKCKEMCKALESEDKDSSVVGGGENVIILSPEKKLHVRSLELLWAGLIQAIHARDLSIAQLLDEVQVAQLAAKAANPTATKPYSPSSPRSESEHSSGAATPAGLGDAQPRPSGADPSAAAAPASKSQRGASSVPSSAGALVVPQALGDDAWKQIILDVATELDLPDLFELHGTKDEMAQQLEVRAAAQADDMRERILHTAESLERNLQRLHTRLEQQQGTIRGLETEKQHLTETVERQKVVVDEVRGELTTLGEQFESLRRNDEEDARANALHASVQAEMQRLRVQNEHLKQENVLLENGMAKMKAKYEREAESASDEAHRPSYEMIQRYERQLQDLRLRISNLENSLQEADPSGRLLLRASAAVGSPLLQSGGRRDERSAGAGGPEPMELPPPAAKKGSGAKAATPRGGKGPAGDEGSKAASSDRPDVLAPLASPLGIALRAPPPPPPFLSPSSTGAAAAVGAGGSSRGIPGSLPLIAPESLVAIRDFLRRRKERHSSGQSSLIE